VITSVRRRGFAAIVLGAFIAFGVSTAAWAALSSLSESDEIVACVHRSSGVIRLASDGATCGNNETAIRWYSKSGVDQAIATVNDRIDNITSRLDNFERTGFATLSAGAERGNSVTAIAACPSGMKLSGGGFSIDGSIEATEAVRVVTSEPRGLSDTDAPVATPGQWWVTIQAYDNLSSAVTVTAIAVCLRLS